MTLWPNAVVFFSSCSPCPSQSCLLRFSHQTLYTSIEGTRRHKSVPTILTETVDKSSVLSLQLYKGDIVISISIRFFPYSKSFFVTFLRASRKKPQIKISVKLARQIQTISCLSVYSLSCLTIVVELDACFWNFVIYCRPAMSLGSWPTTVSLQLLFYSGTAKADIDR